MTNLISRAELARRAGVNQSVITRMCSGSLKAACSGKRIDADNYLVITYLENRSKPKEEALATGIDQLYEKAVALCRESNRWTANFLKNQLRIGAARAKTLMALMEAAGVTGTTSQDMPPPRPPATEATIPVSPPPPKPRGTRVHKAAKRAAVTDDDQILHIPENITDFLGYTLQELILMFGTDVRFEEWLKAVKTIEDINSKRIANAVSEGKLVSRDLITKAVIDPVDAMLRKLLSGGAKTIALRQRRKVQAGDGLKKCEADVRDQISSFIRPMKARTARMLKAI